MGWGCLGHGGCPHTHMHAHTCACMHMHAHVHTHTHHTHTCIHVYHVYNMFNMHVCVCMHAHACVHGTPTTPTPPLSTHLPPPRGAPGICQNLITLKLIKIFQFCFKDLKSVQTPPPMGGCIVWWVGLMGRVRSND